MRATKAARKKVDFHLGESYYFLGKLEARKSDMDRSFIKIVPTKEMTKAPKEWDITSHLIKEHGIVDTFAIHIGDNADLEIDSIHISSTWEGLF